LHYADLARPLKERRKQFPLGVQPNDISFSSVASLSPRKRLFNLLDTISIEPVTWVTGPPGSGKTSLVRSYLQTRDFRCLWFSLDEGTLAKGTEDDWYQFFLDVEQQLLAGSILIFDNVHHVSDTAPLFEIFVRELPRLSRKARIIFISRRNPPPPFIRLQANQSIGFVGWGDLQFTQEEFFNIPEQPGNSEIAIDNRHHLYEQLDGWIAGLHLLQPTGKQKTPLHEVHGHQDLGHIFEYFDQEIYRLLSSEEQTFLLQVALIPSITSRQAEALTNNSQSHKILDALYRANVFLKKQEGSRPIYHFHSLFREFILEKGTKELEFEIYRELQEKAADLLFQAGNAENGINILARAGSWQALAQKTVDHSSFLMKTNYPTCLGGLINNCPIALINANPWLTFWHGANLLSENYIEGRAILAQASDTFKNQREDRGFWMSWTAIVESYFSEGRCFEELDHWIEEGQCQAKNRGFFSRGYEARVTGTMLAAMLFRQPDHCEFSSWFNRAENNTLNAEVPRIQRLALNLQIMQSHCWSGSVEKAEQLLPAVTNGTNWDQLPLSHKIMRESLSASLAWQKADFAECIRIIEQHMVIAQTERHHVNYLHLFVQIIFSCLAQEKVQRAKKYLRKMSACVAEDRPYGMAIQYMLKSLIHSHCYEHQKALNLLDRAEKSAFNTGVPGLEMDVQAAKGLSLAKVGRTDEAYALLKAAKERSRILGNRIIELSCSLYMAKILFDRGEEKPALITMQKALKIGREHGIFHWPLWDREICSYLFVRALEAGVEKKYVTQLIRSHQSTLVPPPLGFGHWFWPLRIYTMGRFAILRDEERVDHGSRGQQKPVILLQALIALGGRNVSDMQLADVLWPDADGDMQLQTLRTTLHRLRQLLGFKEAITYVDGQLTLNSTYCWVDTWAFERLLGDVEKFWKYEVQKGKPEGIVHQAFSFYQGAFLPHKEHEHWTLFLRERLRRKFILNSEKLGSHLENENRWQDAVNCYQKTLSIDPLVERCYQRLMICFFELGQPSEAVATYHRCHQLLSSSIGIKPSQETTLIFQGIQSN